MIGFQNADLRFLAELKRWPRVQSSDTTSTWCVQHDGNTRKKAQ
jgi:hypothetical protein